MKDKILLGFEVGSGKPVHIHLHHLFTSGMTRLSGKTTTLEALVERSEKRAITFRTKRGEIGFDSAKRIPPFYFEEVGWVQLQELVEHRFREKVRFERAWFIYATEKCKTWREVQARVRNLLQSGKWPSGKPLRDLDRNVFTNIDAYLALIVPDIETIRPSTTLELGDGVNVMDIIGLTTEMQALIIRSTLQRVISQLDNVIVVMPEAWKFLPQTMGSPVKRTAEHFIREGGSIGNLLWIDSQDLVGVDKRILRSVDIFMRGRQKEPPEVEALLKLIPVPKSEKPKDEEIQTLQKGHFYAVIGDDVRKVYVQPTWLDEPTAIQVAVGKLHVEDLEKPRAEPSATPTGEPEKVEYALTHLNRLDDAVQRIEHELREIRRAPRQEQGGSKAGEEVIVREALPTVRLEETVYDFRLPDEPSTPLGRVLVSLKRTGARSDKKWTRIQIRALLKANQWPDEGGEQAIDDLVRWAILEPIKAGNRTDYRFHGDRVKTVQKHLTKEVH